MDCYVQDPKSQEEKIHHLVELTEHLCKICVAKNQQIEQLKGFANAKQFGNVDVLQLLEENRQCKEDLNVKDD